AAKLAVEESAAKYGEGIISALVKEHILENFYAFELMMAPYAVGHLKMSFLLEELGYKLQEDDRFKLYLTNTLEMEELAQTELPGMASLSKESHSAGEVKKEKPILVLLGNPPYSVSSANKSNFIEGYFTQKKARNKRGKKQMLKVYIRGILDDYKDAVRKEKNIQPLSDDYIKFIRFAHWKIEQIGKGVIGMITNNSYLSGLIHRGMRKKLLETFDKIYILNLHGNSRIGERCLDGRKDENVFDIMQGVSIVLFIKSRERKTLGKVFYQDVYGLREDKYDYLNKNDIKTIKWKELKLSKPYYFFVEKDFSLQATYEKFISVAKIFNKFSSGVTTHRDHFVVGFAENEVRQRIQTFTSDLPDEIVAQSLDLKETTDWNIKDKREIIKITDWRKNIRPYSYRPFDNRYICYRSELIDRDRIDIMRNFFKENLGLAFMRQYLYDSVKTYNYAFAVSQVSDRRMFISNRGAAVFSPLYLYPDTSGGKLPGHQESEKKPNFKPEFVKSLTETFGRQPTPEEVFYYIYAILYSDTYRLKYAEFLKIDFPRIPFTKDYNLFIKIGKLGKRLVDLHLLKSDEPSSSVAKFQGTGNNKVEKPKYNEKEKRVYINNNQYFEGIKQEIWNYQIGGYYVLDKWLKSRKGRTLSLTDITHYCNIATSLKKTIEIQKKIDNLYSQVEKGIVEVKLGMRNIRDVSGFIKRGV
ncbi:MAG: DNA methyltransferase, partial [Candidatus Omnitrophica bacterium]|nr:DNA methyltransferase [Candidatus Omnitrophota bacterium]